VDLGKAQTVTLSNIDLSESIIPQEERMPPIIGDAVTVTDSIIKSDIADIKAQLKDTGCHTPIRGYI
jgi:hypothetical protein